MGDKDRDIAEELLAERQRQIFMRGYTATHDDGHTAEEWVRLCTRRLLSLPHHWYQDRRERFRQLFVQVGALSIAAIRWYDRNHGKDRVTDAAPSVG
jgi:hypothetical protein